MVRRGTDATDTLTAVHTATGVQYVLWRCATSLKNSPHRVDEAWKFYISSQYQTRRFDPFPPRLNKTHLQAISEPSALCLIDFLPAGNVSVLDLQSLNHMVGTTAWV